MMRAPFAPFAGRPGRAGGPGRRRRRPRGVRSATASGAAAPGRLLRRPDLWCWPAPLGRADAPTSGRRRGIAVPGSRPRAPPDPPFQPVDTSPTRRPRPAEAPPAQGVPRRRAAVRETRDEPFRSMTWNARATGPPVFRRHCGGVVRSECSGAFAPPRLAARTLPCRMAEWRHRQRRTNVSGRIRSVALDAPVRGVAQEPGACRGMPPPRHHCAARAPPQGRHRVATGWTDTRGVAGGTCDPGSVSAARSRGPGVGVSPFAPPARRRSAPRAPPSTAPAQNAPHPVRGTLCAEPRVMIRQNAGPQSRTIVSGWRSALPWGALLGCDYRVHRHPRGRSAHNAVRRTRAVSPSWVRFR